MNITETINAVYDLYLDADESDQEEFRNYAYERLHEYHHSLGRDIRNEFKLWENEWTPKLDEHGVDCSEEHPDAISMKIIQEVWKRVQ